MNQSRLFENHANLQKKTYKSFGGRGNTEYPFKLLKLSALESGCAFPVRFLWPEPSKNPDGAVLISTHKIMEKTEKREFLAAECLPEGEGYPAIENALALIDKHGYFEILKNSKNTENLCPVIKDLEPWRRYWIPCYIWAKEVPPVGESKWSTYVPSDPKVDRPLDRIMEVNASIKMVEKLFETFRTTPDMCSASTGRNISLIKKGNSYTIDLDINIFPLEPGLIKFASDNYPDLNRIARTGFKLHRTPTEIYTLLQAQWWFPYLANKHDNTPGDKNEDGTIKGMGLSFPEPIISIPAMPTLSNQPEKTTTAAPRGAAPEEEVGVTPADEPAPAPMKMPWE